MEGRQSVRPTVLTIAGFDPSGGAGAAADLKTIAALRCYGVAALTAVTVQNTQGVAAVHALPADWLAAQIEAIAADADLRAVKIGMLGTAQAVDTVARLVETLALPNVVLDPVLRSSSGADLLEAGGVERLRSRLLPCARVVTPNLEEAGRLIGHPVRDVGGMKDAARELHRLGARAAVVTGGHLQGRPVDVAFDGVDMALFDSGRVGAPPIHGLGCAFSSAIACGLARGMPLFQAVDEAKRHIARALGAWLKVGKGRGVLDHLAP